MKTKLLKRLRREAENKIELIQAEMRDMGCGRDVFHINGFITRSASTPDEIQQALRLNRRDYIIRRVAELKRKKK